VSGLSRVPTSQFEREAMPSYSVNQLFVSLADAGRELMRGRLGNRRRSPDALAEELLSARGEASGAALAREVIEAYGLLDRDGKQAFFSHLAEHHDVDREAVASAIEAYQAEPDDATLRRLRAVCEPRRHELFRRLNMAPDGTRRLVAMRQDLLGLLPDHPALCPVDTDLQELLAGWFNPGFLTFKTIDWNSPASLLEKLIRYERVHKIANLEALRRRLGPDRRCFAFFHPTLPDEPLIFVQVALVKGLADRVQPLLDSESPIPPAGEADTAIFYSISNCQAGLKGVSLGNFLIKMVVAALEAELPQLRHFATLSPIPGFRAWLGRAVDAGDPVLGPEARAALATLDDPDWPRDPAKAEAFKPWLMGLCAHYLVREKKGGRPLDPVARFHLGNGARLERLNWLGDVSAKGSAESASMLVNYRYDQARIPANHEAFVATGEVIHSSAVKGLLPSLPAAA
jgi:malonyl-CoA decarboxylase